MKLSINAAVRAALVAATALALVACGGGGSSGGGNNGNTRTGSGPLNGTGAVSSTGNTNNSATSKPLVATLDPATAPPQLTSAVCASFTGTPVNPILSSDADVQAIYNALGNSDQSAYAAFIRAPEVFTYWTRQDGAQMASLGGKNVNFVSLGAGLHETLHTLDSALTRICNSDGYRRYYVDGVVQASGLKSGDTLTYSIIAETYPQALRTSRSLRYDLYVVGLGQVSGNQFGMVLDEFSAYAAGANLELTLLRSIDYNYLATSPALQLGASDLNAGGMVDFMLYLQSYLMAARLNHPATHNAIAMQPATKALVQLLWTKSETLLTSLYPYSEKAGGNRLVIPTEVIAQIYSAAFLQELDILGITHKSAADFSGTYLKP